MVKVLCYKLLNKIIDVTDQEDYEMFHNWVETMLYRTDIELNIVKPY